MVVIAVWLAHCMDMPSQQLGRKKTRGGVGQRCFNYKRESIAKHYGQSSLKFYNLTTHKMSD